MIRHNQHALAILFMSAASLLLMSGVIPAAEKADGAVVLRRPLDPPETYGNLSSHIQSLHFSSDGKQLVAWTKATVASWDITKRKAVFSSLRQPDSERFVAPKSRVFAFNDINRDAKGRVSVATVQYEQKPLDTHDMRTGRKRPAVTFPHHAASFRRTAAFSPDGRWMAMYGRMGLPPDRQRKGLRAVAWQVVIVEMRTGKTKHQLTPQFAPSKGKYPKPAWIWTVGFSNDGRYVAAASNDGVVTVWDAARGGEHAVFFYEGGYRESDGRDRLAWIGAHDSVIVPAQTPVGFVRCDLKSKTVIPLGPRGAKDIGVPFGPKHTAFTVSPTGDRLVNSLINFNTSPATAPPLIVDDLSAGRSRGRIQPMPNDRVSTLSYSPDGKLLAIGTMKGNILIYAAEDIEALARAKGTLHAAE